MKLSNIKYYANGYLANKRLSGIPIIIGGCERSGTSLLQSIISSHPDIHAIEEETWAFCYGPATGFTTNNPINIRRLYKSIGKTKIPTTCSRWSEKSPANVFYFDEILKHFSNNVKLINIVRDGRDVVTSMHPENPLQPWVSIDRWVQAVENGKKYAHTPQVLTIKYEDLIINFNDTAIKICNHVGVEANNQILNWHNHATIRSNKNLIGTKVRKLTNKSINKFKSEDFQHQNIVDNFMTNKQAVSLLKYYDYL